MSVCPGLEVGVGTDFTRHNISIWSKETVLKLDCGDGYAAI